MNGLIVKILALKVFLVGSQKDIIFLILDAERLGILENKKKQIDDR